MARSRFETTSALREVRQSPDPWIFMQSNTFFGKFIGPLEKPSKNETGTGIIHTTSENAVVQIRMELMKTKGDKITFPLMAPLTLEGQVDDGDLEGNEEALEFFDFSVELKSTGHAVRGDGDLSDRRVLFNARTQAKMALSTWMGRKIDLYTLMALSGLPSADGNVAEVAPASDRKWIGGQTAAGVLTQTASNTHAELTVQATYLFGPRVIETVHRKAVLSEPKIRPIVVDGKDNYVMFIHPYQTKALKATAEWADIQKNANVRSATKNPIFSGALGMWDGVWLHEWERLETRLGAGGATVSEYFNDSGDPLPNGINAARALFCGAQAAVQAFGRMPRQVSRMFDYRRKWGVGIDCHLAVAKPVFNSLDYGIIVVDTTIVPDS